MRKLLFLLFTAVATTLGCQALNVTTTAGGLGQAVGQDVDITTLAVTGTLDARDFLFITEELNELTTLDLSQATIAAYDKGVALYGTLTRYKANEIPRTAFFGKKLTSIVLPGNLESIGYGAFAGCYQLTSITIPESVVFIDDYAFSGSALTSVVVPAAVTVMGKGVFSRCESLESARVDGGSVGKFAFLGDLNLSDVQIGANVAYIDEGAFNGCSSLSFITIDPANHMTRIGDEAFINSGIESLDIVNLPLGTIGDWALAQTQLGAIALSDGMTVLGQGALAHNLQLASVVLPAMGHNNGGRKGAPGTSHTLSQIDDYTFAGDGMLNAGNLLKNGIVRIGDYAFYNVNAQMDTMRLPSTIEYLGTRAMAGMIGMLTLKTDAAAVPALGEEVWEGVDQPSVPLITVDNQSTMLYKEADQWMNFYFAAPDYLLGDVNGDGAVDINDVTTLIDYLLGSDADVNELAADMNADGAVDINDVTALIDYLLGGSAKMSLQRINALSRARFATTTDYLSAEPITLRAGENRGIDVSLNNDEGQYTAIQCEVVVPTGVRLIGVNGIDRGKGYDCYFIQHENDENVYTMIVVSMEHETFSGNEGKVLTMTVGADEEFNSAELTLTNVRLVSQDNNSFLADDAISRINNTSGIEQVTADKQVAAVRYINVAGQESETPFDGVNIVVTTYTDGTVTTVKVIK